MPSKEVTFANLNDNIDNKFLEEMCVKFGEIDECRIFYHPKTKKHLGLGKVIFQMQRSAKECCQALNSTTKMGNVMSVFIDTLGAERAKMVEVMCNTLAASTAPPLHTYYSFSYLFISQTSPCSKLKVSNHLKKPLDLKLSSLFFLLTFWFREYFKIIN